MLLGLVLINLIVQANRRLWRTYDPRFYRDRVAFCRDGAWDLVVAGGSPAMAGIDADVLEGLRWRGKPVQRAFNLGLPLGTVVDVSLAAEHGLSKKPPRLLVYGVAITDLNGSRVEPQGQRFLMNWADLWRWTRLRPERARSAVREFLKDCRDGFCPLARHNDGLRFCVADWLDRHWDGFSGATGQTAARNLHDSELLQRNEGCLSRSAPTPDRRLSTRKALGQREPFAYLDRYDVSGHYVYLQRLLNWTRANGVELVLVEMPMAADLERDYPREFAQFRTLLREVAQRQNLQLLTPTRQQLGLTDAEFLDLVHLNGDGVARFSVWLRRALEDAAQ